MFIDGLKLRLEAYRQGLRMLDIAKRAGVSATTLSSIANGNRCTAETARKIADTLSVPVANGKRLRKTRHQIRASNPP